MTREVLKLKNNLNKMLRQLTYPLMSITFIMNYKFFKIQIIWVCKPDAVEQTSIYNP